MNDLAPLAVVTPLDIPLECFYYPNGLSLDRDAKGLYVPSDNRQTNRAAAEGLGMNFLSGHNANARGETHYESSVENGTRYLSELVPADRVVGGDGRKIVFLSGPCGCGKTYAARQLINAKDVDGTLRTLIVTPRASLTASLSRHFDAWSYKNGRLPRDQRFGATCVDSLAGFVCDNGVLNDLFSIVFIDEIATLLEHLLLGNTLDRNKLARKQALEVLLAVVANADLVIVADKDIGVTERWFFALPEVLLSPVDYVFLKIRQTAPLRLIRLPDRAHAFLTVAELVEADKRVAYFEPSNKQCQALVKQLKERFPAKADRIVGIHSRSSDKGLFSTDPDAFVREKDLCVLVYTTAVGVGIDISQTCFDAVFTMVAPYLSYRDYEQASWRVRKMTQDEDEEVEQIRAHFLVASPLLKSGLWRKTPLLTVQHAVWHAEMLLNENKAFIDRYASFSSLMPTGEIKLPDTPLMQLMATAFLCRRLALQHQGIIFAQAVFDEQIEVIAFEQDKKDARMARKRRAEVEADVDVDDRDRAPVRNDDRRDDIDNKKRNLIKLFGLASNDPRFEDAEFMFVAGKVAKADIVHRFRALFCTVEESAALDAQRAEEEISTVGLRALSEEGVVARECAAVRVLLSCFGVADPDELLEKETAWFVPNALPEEDVKLMVKELKKLQPARYANVRAKEAMTLSTSSINGYFGLKVFRNKQGLCIGVDGHELRFLKQLNDSIGE